MAICKTPDSPNDVLNPTDRAPVCRDVPSEQGTDIVSKCSFCSNCIMREDLMVAAGKTNDLNRRLIKEVNIRLAGFGGTVPTDQFTAQTERAVKQFQRDYMRLSTSSQNGFLCRSVIAALDRFNNEHSLPTQVFTGNSICPCTRGSGGNRCTGFGSNGRNEYPGFHRSLCWMLKAAIFYMNENQRYAFREVYSGYRCNYDNTRHNRATTNHMGNAFDIHFNDQNGNRERNAQAIRNAIFIPSIGASEVRTDNVFYLEPQTFRNGSPGARTWVHIDCNRFDVAYKDNEFYVQNVTDAEGQTLVTITGQVAPAILNCQKE